MKNSSRLHRVAREIRLEYLTALGGTRGIIPNSTKFKDQLNLIKSLSIDGLLVTADGRLLTTVEQIRAFFGLCQLGRGHWIVQCERHNCGAVMTDQDRQRFAAAHQHVFDTAPPNEDS